jgi:putative NADH-flavin reductase
MIATIFGATGTVGKELIRHCQAKGYAVRAFGRNVESMIDEDLRDDNFKAVKGYVFDAGDVFAAVKGADFVLSALGGDMYGTDKTRSLGIKNIVAQMQKAGVKRIISVGGMGILDSGDGSLIMDNPNFPPGYLPVSQEHLAAYNFLKGSGLDWTMPCPPNILDREADGHFSTKANFPENGMEINAGNLALFMVDEATKNNFVQEKVGIANS